MFRHYRVIVSEFVGSTFAKLHKYFKSSIRSSVIICEIIVRLLVIVQDNKYTEISNLMKIRQVGAELFHADGRKDRRTGMTKPIIALRNFANAPNNCSKDTNYRMILALRRLMSYICGAPILDVSRSHTTTQHSR